mmetsp:Transcript_19361/g.18701  ORF Transcript_19361/g.18701 Transcript_19361/m.18701 type:complete len:81 (+) Transcript_19361:168-410(+)
MTVPCTKHLLGLAPYQLPATPPILWSLFLYHTRGRREKSTGFGGAVQCYACRTNRLNLSSIFVTYFCDCYFCTCIDREKE